MDRFVRGYEQCVSRKRLVNTNVRENIQQSRRERAEKFGIHKVCIHPLQEDASRVKAAASGIRKLPRVQMGRAGGPRVRRLGHDCVVLLGRQRKTVATIVQNDSHSAVG